MVQVGSTHIRRARSASPSVLAFALLCVACSRESNFDSKASDVGADATGDSSESGTPAQEAESARSGDGSPEGSLPGGADSGSQGAKGKGTDGGSEAIDSTLASRAADKAIVSELVQLPKQSTALAIDRDSMTPELADLQCQKTFALKVLLKDGSVAPDTVRWSSSNRQIVNIEANGQAKVVGSGKVTLVAVGTQRNGGQVQDSIELDIAPAFSGYRLMMTEKIGQVITPSRTQKNADPAVFRSGLARGRIRLDAAAPNLDLESVVAPVHSRDFTKFVFSDFQPPKHDPEKCSSFVEFKMEFTNFFVADVTEYTAQSLTVNFKAATKRAPHSFSWGAILIPEGVTAPTPTVVNSAPGTVGFSSDPASSP